MKDGSDDPSHHDRKLYYRAISHSLTARDFVYTCHPTNKIVHIKYFVTPVMVNGWNEKKLSGSDRTD